MNNQPAHQPRHQRATTVPALLAATAISFGVAHHGFTQILAFDFAGLAGNESMAQSSTNHPGLEPSRLTRGAGLAASANADRFNASSWATVGIPNAVSGNDYMEFTITPIVGKRMNVANIVAQWQRSEAGNVGISLRNSLDAYAADIDGEKAVADNASTQTFSWNIAQGDCATAVTYRLYSWAESTSGSGGPGDGAGYDLVVLGTVSNIVGVPPMIGVTGTPGTLSTNHGSASAWTSVLVAGCGLTEPITAVAPAGFEVSCDKAVWETTTLIGQNGGSACETLHVRLRSTAAVGHHSGNVTLSSAGADSVPVPVAGMVALATPATTVPMDVTPTSFSIHWAPISGATGYEVDVFAGRRASATSRLIVSQYVETDAGTTPKGIEVFNVSSETIDFAAGSLVVKVGINGGTPAPVATVSTGTLAHGKVLVLGTSDIGTSLAETFGEGVVPFQEVGFTWNGDDALVVELDGVIQDVIGTPGTDPGTAWASNGVSTANQNLGLLATVLDGDSDGWTDPSLRFETVSTSPSAAGGLSGFGQPPFPLENYVVQAAEVAGGNTTSYSVTGLHPGTEYTYVVRAADAASGCSSPNSIESSVVLPGGPGETPLPPTVISLR